MEKLLTERLALMNTEIEKMLAQYHILLGRKTELQDYIANLSKAENDAIASPDVGTDSNAAGCTDSAVITGEEDAK